MSDHLDLAVQQIALRPRRNGQEREVEPKMTKKVFTFIEPVSKKDRIVSAIKDAIFSGNLSPGDSIVESKIARELGVGTPLVREALIELEHQGFVQRFPYKGTVVTKLSREEIERHFRLRVELEALAIQWAKERATDAEIDELRDYIHQMKDSAGQRDMDRFHEADLAFHRRIWQLSGNEYLVEALEKLVIPIFAFFVMKSRLLETRIDVADTHGQIVEAWKNTDAAGLRELMKETLTGFREEWLTVLLPESE